MDRRGKTVRKCCVIGITGGLGSGKSEVAGMFRKRGALVIDADRVVHGLLKGRGPAVKAVAKAFGPEYVTPRGVDRHRLGARVFADARALKTLEGILHPLVRKEMDAALVRNARRKLVVFDVPLLLESQWQGMVDRVVVVRATVEQQLERACRRLGISRHEARQRMKRQMPFAAKRKYADHVVDNRGTRADTNIQVQRILEDLGTSGISRRKGL